MFQTQLDRLLAWASGPERQQEILQAKAAFFLRHGEVHEEDRTFEARLGLFVEYYLFDRPLDGEGATPAQAFLDLHRSELEAADIPVFESFLRTVHGVFEVRKLGTKQGLKIREVISGKEYEILERRGLVGLSKGDILEARLIQAGEQHLFSGHFLYHPAEARKAILAEAKRRRRAHPEASSPQLACDLARLALKLERYRTVSVENIYKFD